MRVSLLSVLAVLAAAFVSLPSVSAADIVNDIECKNGNVDVTSGVCDTPFDPSANLNTTDYSGQSFSYEVDTLSEHGGETGRGRMHTCAG